MSNLAHSTKSDLTAEHLRRVLDYDPETGVFTWRWRDDVRTQCNALMAGKPAGSVTERGYLRIRINGQQYRAARLAWLYMTGEWPEHEVDHRDTDGLNNRWKNLRPATRSQNLANRRAQSALGIKGVSEGAPGRYYAHISIDGKKRHLGSFGSKQEASAAYQKAAREAFGEFARGE